MPCTLKLETFLIDAHFGVGGIFDCRVPWSWRLSDWLVLSSLMHFSLPCTLELEAFLISVYFQILPPLPNPNPTPRPFSLSTFLCIFNSFLIAVYFGVGGISEFSVFSNTAPPRSFPLAYLLCIFNSFNSFLRCRFYFILRKINFYSTDSTSVTS